MVNGVVGVESVTVDGERFDEAIEVAELFEVDLGALCGVKLE